MNTPDCRLFTGEVREVLADLPDGSADCCVTSPPYFGLRDYDDPRQIGRGAPCTTTSKTSRTCSLTSAGSSRRPGPCG